MEVFINGVDHNIFEKENVGKLLMKFSIPAIVSLLVAELYNMVDTVFVGRVIGGNAIGALVVVFPIQRIIVAISMMIAIGSSTAIARNNGKKDNESIKAVIKNALSLIFLTMIPMTILIFIFRDNVLNMLGTSKQILPYAHDYLSIIIFGSIFQCLTISIGYIMMSLGDRKTALKSTITGAVTNTIVDYFLVVKLSYGVKGAAFATIFSQFISFIYAYLHFRDIKKEYKLKFGFEIKGYILISIITVGFSAFIVEAEDGILLAVLNNLLLNHVGDIGVIILGVISKLSMFMFITMLGISSAMQPIAAYNLGAKNYRKLKEVVKKTVIFALMTSAILWIIGLLFAEQLISVFVKEREIIVEAAKAFKIMIAVFPMISIYYVSIYYFQALGKARTSFIVSIFRQIIILLPVSILLIKILDLGAIGAWVSYPISDFTASVTSIILMKIESEKLDVNIEKSKSKKIKEKDYKVNEHKSKKIQDDLIQ